MRPVTQKLRPVPVSMMEPLREKLDLYVKEGHLGEVMTIRNIRERNWFPGLAEKCMAFVKSCHIGCTEALPDMRIRDTPDGPWKLLSADYVSDSSHAIQF